MLESCSSTGSTYSIWTCESLSNGFLSYATQNLLRRSNVSVIQSLDASVGSSAPEACSNSTAKTYRIEIDGICSPVDLRSSILSTCNATHEITKQCSSTNCAEPCETVTETRTKKSRFLLTLNDKMSLPRTFVNFRSVFWFVRIPQRAMAVTLLSRGNFCRVSCSCGSTRESTDNYNPYQSCFSSCIICRTDSGASVSGQSDCTF